MSAQCPNSVTDEVAQELLAGAIGYYDDPEEQEHPSALYNVYRGAPFEAVPTRAGVSYHGYPWQGRMPERILEELGARATRDGYEKEFKAWVKKHAKR